MQSTVITPQLKTVKKKAHDEKEEFAGKTHRELPCEGRGIGVRLHSTYNNQKKMAGVQRNFETSGPQKKLLTHHAHLAHTAVRRRRRRDA